MITSLDQIKYNNQRAGKFFFEPGAMRFFNSRVLPNVWPHGDSAYFITSEKFDATTPRRYTIREARPDGDIDTVGAFQEFASSEQARRAIIGLLDY